MAAVEAGLLQPAYFGFDAVLHGRTVGASDRDRRQQGSVLIEDQHTELTAVPNELRVVADIITGKGDYFEVCFIDASELGAFSIAALKPSARSK